jgi:hypothetical protein
MPLLVDEAIDRAHAVVAAPRRAARNNREYEVTLWDPLLRAWSTDNIESVRHSVYVWVAIIVALTGPRLAAQEVGTDALHAADTVHRVILFPRSLAASPTAAPSRFQVLAHEIDSLSAIGGQMETAAEAREQSAQAASRFFVLAQATRGFGRRVDWVSAVTAAGITQLGLAEPNVWGTLRGDGQIAGLAGLTGGASWLLSNLTRYTPRFGLSHGRPSLSATHEH